MKISVLLDGVLTRLLYLIFNPGHIIPESKGGPTTIENLMPICSRCNLSMNNQYTITEWNTLGSNDQSFFKRVSSKLRLCLRLLLN